MLDQGHQQQMDDHEDCVKQAAVKAAFNTPARSKARTKAAAAAAKASTLPRLHSFEDLPDYLRDNEYIVGGYRTEQKSVWDSVLTVFSLHNETGNVWTHFLGFFLFLGLAYWFYYHPPTPLAVTAEHLEGMWHELAADVQGLHLGDKAHALTHSFTDRVANLEGRLAHALSDNLHSIQDSIQHNPLLHRVSDGVHSVGYSLQDGLHSLQHGLHAVESQLQSKAAQLGSNFAVKASGWQAVLKQQLQPIVQWPTPRWPVYVYFAGACVCLLTSGVCHLLGCCQRHIAEMVWRFDYAGIAVLIVASFVPAMYYAFLCQPFWRHFYLISTVSMGVAVISTSLPQKFQAREYRFIRAVVFTMLGMWGVVPVTHLLLTHGHVWAIRSAFQLDMLMGLIYLLGAATYACRIPERWYPGKFDIMGHSHQLWHAAVVLAAWVHYCAMMILLQWRDASGGCAVPGMVNGPVHEVLGRMQQEGKAPLGHIDQVHAALDVQLARYMAAGALPMAPPLHPEL